MSEDKTSLNSEVNDCYKELLEKVFNTKSRNIQVNNFRGNYTIDECLNIWKNYEGIVEQELIKENSKEIYEKLNQYFTLLDELKEQRKVKFQKIVEEITIKTLQDEGRENPEIFYQQIYYIFFKHLPEKIFVKLVKGESDLSSFTYEYQKQARNMYELSIGIENAAKLFPKENKTLEKTIENLEKSEEYKKIKKDIQMYKELSKEIPVLIKKQYKENLKPRDEKLFGISKKLIANVKLIGGVIIVLITLIGLTGIFNAPDETSAVQISNLIEWENEYTETELYQEFSGANIKLYADENEKFKIITFNLLNSGPPAKNVKIEIGSPTLTGIGQLSGDPTDEYSILRDFGGGNLTANPQIKIKELGLLPQRTYLLIVKQHLEEYTFIIEQDNKEPKFQTVIPEPFKSPNYS